MVDFEIIINEKPSAICRLGLGVAVNKEPTVIWIMPNPALVSGETMIVKSNFAVVHAAYLYWRFLWGECENFVCFRSIEEFEGNLIRGLCADIRKHDHHM